MMQINFLALAAAIAIAHPPIPNAGGGGGGGGGSSAPFIVTTDIVAGKLAGGENNAGDYLRIIGWNFGASGDFGTAAGLQAWFRDSGAGGDNAWHEVASYRTVGAQRVTPAGLKEAVIQIGALGGSQVAGHTLDFKLTLAGVDSAIFPNYFTVQPGKIWFVSTTGNDSTGVADDINHPFLNAQVWNGTAFTGLCATGKIAPGDTVVFRGGSYTAAETGYDAGSGAGSKAVFRFATTGSWATGVGGGSAPTGAVGHGYIHFTAYPGEDAHFTLSKGGGIQGCESSFASSTDGGHGQYWTVSGIHWEMTSTAARDASGVNFQNGSRHVRAVSNEFGPWATATGTTNAGGLTGVLQEGVILYNDIHDISGNLTDQQNHGIYLGGATGGTYDDASKNVLVRGNWIRNCTAGCGINLYWQNTNSTATSVMTGLDISGNFIQNTLKYGINCGQSCVGALIYNNQVVDCGLNALRVEGLGKLTGQADFAITFAFNTCYGWNRVGSINDSCFDTAGFANYGSIKLEHNIFAAASGRSGSNSWYSNSAFGGADANVTMSQNVYFDYAGTLTGSAAKDASPITTSPLFTNRATLDFTLQAGSSALQAVTTTDSLSLALDILLNARPKGTRKDIGAYES